MLDVKAVPVCGVTLAWLCPVYPGWGPSGPPGCCWWPALSCSCTHAGRPAGSLLPDQAAGPWYTTAETPALPRSPDISHPDDTQTVRKYTKSGRVIARLFPPEICSHLENQTLIMQLQLTAIYVYTVMLWNSTLNCNFNNFLLCVWKMLRKDTSAQSGPICFMPLINVSPRLIAS